MPSYRRDRPERGPRPGSERGPRPGRGPGPGPERPRPFPREEEEIFEEERPSFTPFSRGGGTPFTSRPIPPSERLELEDVLVPKAEREDPRFDYGRVFEMFPRWGRGQRPSPSAGPGPREAPPGPERPRRTPGGAPAFDAGMFFDLVRIWSAAGQLRQDPRFRRGSPVAVVRTAPQAEAHNFFRVRPEEVMPLLEELAYAINYVKPRELPGSFLFQKGADGFLWLAYVE